MSLSQAQELNERTKQFAIRVVRFFRSLPKTEEARIVGKQALRSGQLQRIIAVCRARSKAEFVAKIGVVVEEADETVFWLELLVETGIVAQARMDGLLTEANELLAIFAASQRTSKEQNDPMKK